MRPRGELNPYTIRVDGGDVRNELNVHLCREIFREGVSWMTGGGVKFEFVTDTLNAECDQRGPAGTMGEVVAPACRLERGKVRRRSDGL